MILRRIVLAAIGLLLVGVAAVAQQPSATAPQPQSDTLRERRKDVRRDVRLRQKKRQRLHLSRTLQLTDDQRQLRKAILQRQLDATKAQREQLFQLREKRLAGGLTTVDRDRAKQIRLELRKAMQGARAESLNVLNAEQREQLKICVNSESKCVRRGGNV